MPTVASPTVLVTHIITRLIIGGAQENTLATVLELNRRAGWAAHLISGPTRGEEGSLEAQAAQIPGLLTVLPSLTRPLHPWLDWLAYRQLLRCLRHSCPPIVHTHSGKAGFLGRLAAHRARVPVIIHTIHGPSFGPFQGWAANRLYCAAERRAGRVTTHFVSVAEAMTRRYLQAGIGQPRQYSLIHSGFDLAPFLEVRNHPADRIRWGLAPNDFVIGMIARFFKLKGHADLLAAAPEIFRRCPSAKFLLVGDGPGRRSVEREVREMGMADRFILTGLVPPSAIPSLVGIMDVLVHLSRREGLPRALPQALAGGKPVVALDADGAREVCLPGHTGILLRDLQGLPDAVEHLFRRPEERLRLGAHGRQLAASRFALSVMLEKLVELYERLLANADRAKVAASKAGRPV